MLVHRSSSHPTARNSKERSSVAKGARGLGRREGNYTGGVSRVVQTGAETAFSRARSNSAIGYLAFEILFFGPCFFVPLSLPLLCLFRLPRARRKGIAVSRTSRKPQTSPAASIFGVLGAYTLFHGCR